MNGREPLSARVGAGRDPEISDSSARIESISGIYHDVRCITVIQLPAKYFEKGTLGPGDEFELDSNFVSHGRAYRIEWKGRFKLSE